MNTHCTALDGPPAYATHSEPSPQQIRESVIGNLGWRTGAALRQQRKRPSGAGESEGSPGLGGWRLPPHIRKAHWHRVRIVERDENSHAIGSREGIEGVDWHYELRWYPPTPVNADGGVAPTGSRSMTTVRRRRSPCSGGARLTESAIAAAEDFRRLVLRGANVASRSPTERTL